jgi:hypothetical protein
MRTALVGLLAPIAAAPLVPDYMTREYKETDIFTPLKSDSLDKIGAKNSRSVHRPTRKRRYVGELDEGGGTERSTES